MDMETIMAQAAEMQRRVADAQEELARTTVKGISDAGACIVEMTGKYDLVNITIRDDVASRSAPEIAETVAAAFRDAKAKADATIDRVMGDATAGMPMPM